MSSSLKFLDYNPPGSFSMGFSRQEHWSGLPFPTAGDPPDRGIEPAFPGSSASVLADFFTTEPAAAAAKSLQSCPTLCDSIDGSPPGSPVPGILQARTLEWVAIAFSNAWKWKVKVKSLETPNSLYSILILPAAWTSQPCTSHFYKTLMDTWSPYSFQRYPIDLTF